MKIRIAIYIIITSFLSVQLNAQGSQATGFENTSIPPSPNAAAIAQYSAVPVNKATGTFGLDIPLTSISKNGLSVPVSISYHAGGIRTDQEATCVGLGWSLNAGGSITRTINGTPDEDPAKGYWHQHPDLRTQNGKINTHQNGWDIEADLFFFNVMGLSGKFVINKSGDVKLYSNSRIKIIPGTNLNNWTIINIDGTKYEFETKEYTDVINSAANTNNRYISTWHLDKIIHPNGDEVNFNYAANPIISSNTQSRSASYYISDGQKACSPIVCKDRLLSVAEPTDIVSEIILLEEITTSYERLNFSYSGNQLNRITKKINFITSEYIDFRYSSFYSRGNSHPRLKLDEVQVYGHDGTTTAPFIFDYFKDDQLAIPYSYESDHWGFQNDNNRGYLISNPTTVDDLIHFGNENRKSSDKSLNGLLTKITYPTGLFKSFEYERNDVGDVPNVASANKYVRCDVANCVDSETLTIANGFGKILITGGGSCNFAGSCETVVELIDHNGNVVINLQTVGIPSGGLFFDVNPGTYTFRVVSPPIQNDIGWGRILYVQETPGNRKIGGARIKSITDQDGTRAFIYTLPGSSESSGKLLNKPEYSSRITHYDNCATTQCIDCPGRQFSSVSYNTILSNAHVFYTDVTEQLKNNARIETNFDYTADPPKPLKVPITPRESNDAIRGQVKVEKHYDEANQLRYTVTNEYETTFLGQVESARLFVPSPFCPHFAEEDFYYHYSYWKRLKNSVENFYEPGSTASLDVQTDYTYYNENYQIKNMTKTSGGLSRSTDYKYAPQLYAANHFLNANNMIGMPLETVVDNGLGNGTKIEYTNVGQGIKPVKLYSSVSGGQYEWEPTKDIPGWKCKLEIINFSGVHPQEIWLRDKALNEKLIWQNDLLRYKHYPHINAGIQRTWSFNYDYYRRLTSSADHQGISSTFQYDGLSRLDQSISKNNRVTNNYSYGYQPNYVQNTISYNDQAGTEGRTVISNFDVFGRIKTEDRQNYTQSGSSYMVKTAYDEMGNAYSVDDPGSGGETVNEFEKSVQPRIMQVTPAGSSKSIGYNYRIENNLFVTSITDENGNVSEQHTDFLGRKIKSIVKNVDGNDLLTSYEYNNRDQITKIYPPGNGTEYTYTYYSDGLLKTKTIPDRGTCTYTYNIHDQVQTEMLPFGALLENIYDPMFNELLTQVKKDNVVIKENIFNTNDAREKGWVSSTKSLDETSGDFVTNSMSYDDVGRVTSSFQNYNGYTSGAYSNTYVYDALDNILQDTYFTFYNSNQIWAVFDYQYDKGLRLEKTELSTGGPKQIISELTYNERDWMTNKKIGNNLQSIDYGYNQRGWLTRINSVRSTYDLNVDPCGPDSEPDCPGLEDLLQIWIEYNCDKIVSATPTTINIKLNNRTTVDGGETIETNSEIHIPLYGFDGGKDEDTPDNYNYSSPELIDSDQLSSSILIGLEDCGLDSYIIDLLEEVLGDNDGTLDDGLGDVDPFDRGGGKLFGMNIYYDNANPALQAEEQHNGNISWFKWRVKGEDAHQYGFTYDAADRLKQAIHASSPYDCNYRPEQHYDVRGINYDQRGNILSLQRYGPTELTQWDADNYQMIDDLTYSYANNATNLLQSVTEGATSDFGFQNSSTYSYLYGNLSSDSGKGINGISYNYLYMPLDVQHTNGRMKNHYDSDGVKLKSEITDDQGVTDVYEYLGPAEFKNGEIESIHHSEGRFLFTTDTRGAANNYYEWTIKDHLGNTRVRFVDADGDNKVAVDASDPENDELKESYHYYPFGLNWDTGLPEGEGVENKYQYNGKERIKGLEWQDFGFRFYDPAICRFTGVDPIAEDFAFVSTFNYAENDPIRNIDLWGLQAVSRVEADIERDNNNVLKGNISKDEFVENAKARGEAGVEMAAEGIGVGILAKVGKLFKGVKAVLGFGDKAADSGKAMSKVDDVIIEGSENVAQQSTKQLQKSKESLEGLIKEHQSKLDDFIKDPIGNTDPKKLKEMMKDNPSQEVLKERAMGRAKALQKQINKQKGELDKVNKVLKEKS